MDTTAFSNAVPRRRRGRPRKLSAPEERELLRRVDRNEPYRHIAHQLGVSADTVTNYATGRTKPR